MMKTKEIEIDVKEIEDRIALRDAILRLEKNKDFQKVIMEEYLKAEAQRLVYLRSDPNIMYGQNGDAQKKHNELMLDGIAAFKFYLHITKLLGDQAEASLKEHENTEE